MKLDASVVRLSCYAREVRADTNVRVSTSLQWQSL